MKFIVFILGTLFIFGIGFLLSYILKDNWKSLTYSMLPIVFWIFAFIVHGNKKEQERK